MKALMRFCTLFCIIVLPIIISFIALAFFHKPQTSGTLYLARDGMKTITIYRDEYSIPHIKASNKSDAFYAMGFVHAQDRLWNMHVKRRLFSGRVSELFGSQTLVIDKYVRTLGIRQSAEEMASNLDAETRELTEAYCHGINDYVATLSILPPEFLITQNGYNTLEPWNVADILVFMKFLSFGLTFDWSYELLRADLIDILGQELVEEVIPFQYDKLLSKSVVLNNEDLKYSGLYEKYKPYSPEEKPHGNPDARKSHHHAHPTEKSSHIQEALYDMLGGLGWGKGSNNWVISGKHTESGKPLLANDPHLDNGMPAMWYQIEIVYGDKNVIGVSLPGLPIIPIARSKIMSFGATALYADISDLYNETLSDDGKMYLYGGKWYPVAERTEIINVKGSDPVSHKVRNTRHGPILDSVFDKLNIGRGGPLVGNQNYSFAWTGYIKNDTSLYGILNLLEAETPQDIVKYVNYVFGPANNFVYAFENGDIGYISMTKLPKRKHAELGAYVLDGTNPENDWLGFIPVEENPQIVNPPKGYILSANNKISTDNIKNGISVNIATTARADRIEEMIKEKIEKGEKFTIEDMKRMQLDVIDIYARDTTPKMINLVKKYLGEMTSHISTITNGNTGEKEINELLTILSNWTGNMTVDSVPASIFSAWEYHFYLKLFHEYDIDEELRYALLSFITFDDFIYKKINEWHDEPSTTSIAEKWCQNPETARLTLEAREKACMYDLIMSLYETYKFMRKRFGPDKTKWKYGLLHKSRFNHIPFSDTPFKFIYHREYSSPGNRRTVNVGAWYLLLHDFKGIHGPNYRMVIDMAFGSKSYYILDAGVSENFMSSHYDDQQKLHQKGEYLEMKMGPRYFKDYKEILFLTPLTPNSNSENVNFTRTKPTSRRSSKDDISFQISN